MFFLRLRNKTSIIETISLWILCFFSVLFLLSRNAQANYRLYPSILHLTLQPGEKESHAIHFRNDSDKDIKLKASICTLSSQKNGGRIISHIIPELLEKIIKLSGESSHVSSHHEAIVKLHIKPLKKMKPVSQAVCIAFNILSSDQDTNEKIKSEPLIAELILEIGKLGSRNISLDEMHISHKPAWVDFVLPIKNEGDPTRALRGIICQVFPPSRVRKCGLLKINPLSESKNCIFLYELILSNGVVSFQLFPESFVCNIFPVSGVIWFFVCPAVTFFIIEAA